MTRVAEVLLSILCFIVFVALSPIIIPLLVIGTVAMMKNHEEMW